MFTLTQRNSLAQLGLGLQLGTAIGPRFGLLDRSTWQDSKTQPITLFKAYEFVQLVLRGLMRPDTLHGLPTLWSALHDISSGRIAQHFQQNYFRMRGYEFLPEFDAKRLESICAKLKPVIYGVTLAVLVAFSMRGHRNAICGCIASAASVLISSRFERTSQVIRIVDLTSQLLCIAANPVPMLAVLFVEMGIQEFEYRGAEGMRRIARQICRATQHTISKWGMSPGQKKLPANSQ